MREAYEVEHRVEIDDVGPLWVKLGYPIEGFVEFGLNVAVWSPLLRVLSSTQSVPPAARTQAQQVTITVSGMVLDRQNTVVGNSPRTFRW